MSKDLVFPEEHKANVGKWACHVRPERMCDHTLNGSGAFVTDGVWRSCMLCGFREPVNPMDADDDVA